MAKRAISKWQTVVDEAKNSLSKNGKLDQACVKDKDNSRETIASTFMKIVNAGQALSRLLDSNTDQLDIMKSKYDEKSVLLNSFDTSYNQLKCSMEDNFKAHYEKLENVETCIEEQKKTFNDIKTFADAVKSQSPDLTSTAKHSSVDSMQISNVVKSAVKEVRESNMRASRIVMHNMRGIQFGFQTPEVLAEKLIKTVLGDENVPPIVSAWRIGGKTDHGPCCVQFQSPDVANLLLRKSGVLKTKISYRNVYLSPDRTLEERREHKELVKEFKLKIQEDPSKWWSIRDGKVVSTALRTTSSTCTSESESEAN